MSATLARVLDGLERRSTWKNAALAALGVALVNLAMGAYIFPDIQARRPEALDESPPRLLADAPIQGARRSMSLRPGKEARSAARAPVDSSHPAPALPCRRPLLA